MSNKIIPKTWKYFFYISLGLLLIHFYEYLNFILTQAFPWIYNSSDYFMLSDYYSYIQILLFLLSILLCLKRRKSPVLSTGIIWFFLWILLSHQHDRFTFLLAPLITLIIFYSSYFYRVNGYE